MMSDVETPRAHGVDPRLLEILICPETRQPLQYDRDTDELISAKARLAYPIRNGIPVLVVEEARDLDAVMTLAPPGEDG
jgi:uncharacterized protein